MMRVDGQRATKYLIYKLDTCEDFLAHVEYLDLESGLKHLTLLVLIRVPARAAPPTPLVLIMRI